MDDDYVNKQIICPTCGGKDILYIDLNEIRDDPKVQSGTVTRSFSHRDHLLILDIDYHGAIRTINQIDKKQEIAINQEKYHQILEMLEGYDRILLISPDLHMNLLFNIIIDQIQIDEEYSLRNQDEFMELQLNSMKILWIKPTKLDQIDLENSWKGIFVEMEEDELDPQIITICQTSDKIICSSQEVADKLREEQNIDHIQVL